jgi:hypothetical protein
MITDLKKIHPRYTCFVARPEDAGHDFVMGIHKLCRAYDDDPYTDTLWAILTGYDAASALRIAQHSEPLTIHKVAAGTGIAMEMIEEGGWYDEGEACKKVWKKPGQEPQQSNVPQDSTWSAAGSRRLLRKMAFSLSPSHLNEAARAFCRSTPTAPSVAVVRSSPIFPAASAHQRSFRARNTSPSSPMILSWSATPAAIMTEERYASASVSESFLFTACFKTVVSIQS